MNYLPIIAIVIMVALKNQDDYKSLLQKLPLEEISSLLPLMGINEQMITTIKNLISALLNGNINTATILKSLLPIMLSMNNQNQSENLKSEKNNNFDEIKDVASSEILTGLSDYFS